MSSGEVSLNHQTPWLYKCIYQHFNLKVHRHYLYWVGARPFAWTHPFVFVWFDLSVEYSQVDRWMYYTICNIYGLLIIYILSVSFFFVFVVVVVVFVVALFYLLAIKSIS